MPQSTILEINIGRVASVRVAPNEDMLKRSIRRQLILVRRAGRERTLRNRADAEGASSRSDIKLKAQ
jgi:hypothetical protein